MSDEHLTRELIDNPIISMSNAISLGRVEDIVMDPDSGQVAAIVTSEGGLLKRAQDRRAIPAADVRVWGQDAILVTQSEVIVRYDEAAGSQEWLSIADRIKGRDVVSLEGQRIGTLDDIVLDTQGQVVAYALAQVFIGGPVAESRRIPAEATHAFGADVLIIDSRGLPAVAQGQEAAAEEQAPGNEPGIRD